MTEVYTKKQAPNIVMIVSDQHRADWMGCAGASYLDTPNLDRLAEGGVRFTNAYCNAPLCVPSRMSMLSGRYPYRTEVWGNEHELATDIPTFVHALGLAGYETVLCGRMHFKGPDQRHGYQRRLVGDITPTYNGGQSAPYGRLKGTAAQGMLSLQLSGPGDSPVIRYDEAVTDACEQLLETRFRSGENRSLFLTVGYYGPHPTFICPPDTYASTSAAMDGIEPISRDEEPTHPWVADWFKRLKIDNATSEDVRRVRASYAGLVQQLDRHVGRVLEAARSLPGDTIVVYVSDHGEMAGDHGMFWKQSFYEGSAAVPMIWHPLSQETAEFQFARGRMVDVPVSLLDLAPTLVGLSGAPEMPGLDGNDLRPLLLAGAVAAQDAFWTERPVFCEMLGPSRMIRYKQYKLNYYNSHASQLFDLESDPHEKRDLFPLEAYAGVRNELLSLLLDDWKPERIRETVASKIADVQYLTQWGKQIGFGRMDLWPSDYSDY
ncbi:sulfatase-like hydrolase/transferase [Paenibacillus allorhizosphaerae]|uniref:Choline-sulfatase n=1 Tax=Paenibacillus allorhizosphaerae TaxID=2849866 RepID=A0ABM8VAB0_9BACL|nr:sulfatase-like hydrolase/transferase [Paenibacillus allorhizosphaerae]CAG7613847.1 Choline-sulfatase [Paenibacillus allorhizosphaerae]